MILGICSRSTPPRGSSQAINTVCQGSAADLVKKAMPGAFLKAQETPPRGGGSSVTSSYAPARIFFLQPTAFVVAKGWAPPSVRGGGSQKDPGPDRHPGRPPRSRGRQPQPWPGVRPDHGCQGVRSRWGGFFFRPRPPRTHGGGGEWGRSGPAASSELATRHGPVSGSTAPRNPGPRHLRVQRGSV